MNKIELLEASIKHADELIKEASKLKKSLEKDLKKQKGEIEVLPLTEKAGKIIDEVKPWKK